MDKKWYLDVNHFAHRTAWAHGFMKAYFSMAASPVGAGLLVLAALVVAGWWSARRRPDCMAAVLWSAIGAFAALGLCLVLARVLAKPHPYQVLRHVEVLVPRPGGYALPDGRAAMAGAVVCGLLLGRRWRLAAVATGAALLLLFSGVYVGTDYPSDVAAGFGFGLVAGVVLWPLGTAVLSPVVGGLADGVLALVVASRSAPRVAGAKPLAVPRPAARLPNARAMDALKAATEAARHAPPAPTPTDTSSIRTTAIPPPPVPSPATSSPPVPSPAKSSPPVPSPPAPSRAKPGGSDKGGTGEPP